MTTRSRVPSYEKVEQTDSYDKQDKPASSSTRAEEISTKIHAFFWVLGGAALAYFLDFFKVLFGTKGVNRAYLDIGFVAFGINCCITFYLAIWLPRIRNIHLEWSVYCPRMIPLATFFGAFGTIAFIIGLWPSWGFFTPGILFVLFVSCLMSAHFLPAI